MNFELWLEAQYQFSVNPDTLYQMKGFDTFIHDMNSGVLYVAKAQHAHSDILGDYFPRWRRRMEDGELEGLLFGRFGELNDENMRDMTWEQPKLIEFIKDQGAEFPVQILAYWKDWNEIEADEGEVKRSIKCFLSGDFKEIEGNQNEKFPTGENLLIIDGYNLPHFYNQEAQKPQNKTFSVGNFHFTSEEVNAWMGMLHFLPKTSPMRATIMQNAKIIANSPYASQFRDFVIRANVDEKPIKMKISPWSKEADRQKIKTPGHKLWALSSENKLI